MDPNRNRCSKVYSRVKVFQQVGSVSVFAKCCPPGAGSASRPGLTLVYCVQEAGGIRSDAATRQNTVSEKTTPGTQSCPRHQVRAK